MSERGKYGQTTPYGMNMPNSIRFEQTQPLGSNGRTKRVAVEVSREMVIGIARFLQAGCVAGHAVWHYQNPHRDFPCPNDPACTNPPE
jgi:hypothetical protein